MSGNLKPWPISGSPPKQPLSFREPVPQGLIESIGHHVQHLDTFGGKFHQQQAPQQSVYLPPPPKSVPVANLHALPLEQPAGQFLNQHNLDFGGRQHQNYDTVSFSHQHTCTQGPHFGGTGGDGYHAQSLVQSYDTAASTQQLIQQHNAKLETPESSYGPPPTGIVAASNIVSQEVLPGLDGLNVISAQRSHSIDVPPSGAALNNYEVQFQKSIASDGGSVPLGGKHDHLINDGLLQSIISAVEQPNSNIDQASHPSEDSEVKIIFKNHQQEENVEPKEVDQN